MSVTLLRKINKAANDPSHFDNNYLGEVLEEAYIFIEQLKKDSDDLKTCQTMTELNFEGYVEMKQEEVAQLKKENEALESILSTLVYWHNNGLIDKSWWDKADMLTKDYKNSTNN